MFYTRRKLLRDAALAAGVSSAFPVLSRAFARPDAFASGVRIFFIGTWLFCKDPLPDPSGAERLLAITVDDGMGHSFPYGPWKDASFDSRPSLLENQHAKERAFRVGIYGFQNPSPTTQQLFSDAKTNCEFVYATIAQANLQPNLNKADMRVISIPLPKKLYAGIFADKHTLSTSDSTNYNLSGSRAATGHIFEYPGGTLSTKDSSNAISTSLTGDYQGDFHFRTVPPDCTCHGPKMFEDMLYTVFNVPRKTIQLSAPCDHDVKPDPGPYLPTGISNDELDIIDVSCPAPKATSKGHSRRRPKEETGNEHVFFRTTAACAGASIGVLGGY